MSGDNAQHPAARQGLRVLLLDDSARDAALIAEQLARLRPTLALHQVSTREGFLTALAGPRPDVILAEPALARFDGDSALDLARQIAPQIPVIVVGGSLSEEHAVDALRRGATDYVVKQRLQRLPEVVQRALGEAHARTTPGDAEAVRHAGGTRLQAIVDALPVLIAEIGPDHRYRMVNLAYKDWFGLDPAEVEGRHAREVLGEAAYQHLRPSIERVLQGEQVSFESTLPYRHTSLRQVHIQYVPARAVDGRIDGYYVVAQDISERKAHEAALRDLNETLEHQVHERTLALRHSEARLRAIFETSFQHHGLLSLEGRLLDSNAAALESILSTRAEVLGKPYWETPWFSATPEMPGLIRQMVERAAMGESVRQEVRLELPTGQRWFDFSMRPLRDHDGQLVAIVPEAVETTARRDAEEALRQAQKMEAVGQLTGGIAHDFNNLLTVIGGNIDIAHARLERAGQSDPRLLRPLQSAQKGAERATALIHRLLAFSRRQPLQPRALDLTRLMRGMSDLLRRSLGETIALELITAPGLWRVEADPNQLEAALLNLAVNARDAMPDGGRLSIEAANASLEHSPLAHHPELAPGQYVFISVTDTGCGIPPESLGRVFEPFFTTKEVGRGTGLGLSMVYGFIRQSGGHVQIHSEPGRGTTVKLFLPRLHDTHALEEDEPAPARVPTSVHAETVLVAEDDDDVRAYTVECLRGLGYRVLEAHDGTSALRLLARQESPVQLLFTDVVMPGLSGRELADRARALQPQLRILYTSGYTRDAIAQGGRADLGIALLPKPFTYTALAARVREVLDRAVPPDGAAG